MPRPLIWISGTLLAVLTGAGIALAGSQHGVTVSFAGAEVPLFALCCFLAFAVQWLSFIPAYLFQSEKFYDLTGSLTYIGVTLLALAMAGNTDVRSLVIGTLVTMWALRLGSFLFRRVLQAGEDRRFRSIKPDFLQFFMTWTLQGLWVSVTYAAGLAAITSSNPVPVDAMLVLGGVLWISGFTIEVVADRQKSQFRAREGNSNRFIREGLWAWSRHPNYFGEILLWIGIAVAALPVLQGWQYVCLISPVFVVFLLTRISGVRMLEARADRQWGDDVEYQAYKAATPRLVPFPPKAG